MATSARSRAARVAALTRWAHERDPKASIRPARKGFLAKFEREVDPDGSMDPAERAKRAGRLLRAHMTKLSAAAAAKRSRTGAA